MTDAIEQAIQDYERDAYRQSPVDRRVALHEGAHVVVGWLVGGTPLVEVAIADDGSGYADNTLGPRPTDPAELEAMAAARVRLQAEHPQVVRAVNGRAITSVLAGITADQRQGLRDWWCSREDLASADRLAEAAVGRKDRDRFLAQLRPYVKLAVHDGWSLIETFADLLQDQRRLPGQFAEAWLAEQPGALSLRTYYARLFEVPEEGTVV